MYEESKAKKFFYVQPEEGPKAIPALAPLPSRPLCKDRRLTMQLRCVVLCAAGFLCFFFRELL
jgi:hypothetical protein